MVPCRAHCRRDRHGDGRQSNGRVSVHEIHGRRHGCRHGSRRRGDQSRTCGRAAGCTAGTAGIRWRGWCTRRPPCTWPSTPRCRRDARHDCSSRRFGRRSGARRRKSTMWYISTSTAASRAACTSRATPARNRARRLPAPERHRGTAVSRWAGERVHDPFDRADGTRAARRSRLDRIGERCRDEHDQARLWCVFHASRSGDSSRRGTCPGGDRCRRHGRDRRVLGGCGRGPRPTRSCTIATGIPSGRCSFATSTAAGARVARGSTDPDLVAGAESEELVGRRVRLEPVEALLATGPGHRNIATY